MATKITLPELGEGIEKGTITKILVEVGDDVEQDQAIVEVESDKATVEVPASEGGKVSEIKVSEGDEIKVGGTILVLDGAAKKEDEKEKKADKKEEKPKKKGAKAEAPEAEVEEEPDYEEETAAEEEPDEEAPEEKSGEPARKKAREDRAKEKKKARDLAAKEKRAESPKPKARAEEEPEEEDETVDEEEPDEEPAEKEKKPAKKERSGSAVAAAPSVRRLARQIGVDIDDVKPSSPSGRITSEDVKAYARGTRNGGGAKAPSKGAVSTGKLPDFEKWGEVEREKMSGIRAKTAERMAASWNTVAHVTQDDRADVTELEAFRQENKKEVEQEGGKLTLTAILVKAVVHALHKFPKFNASIDLDNNELVYKHYYNIGIAVDTPRGLVVPVLRDADEKSLVDIAIDLDDIANKARDGKLAIDDMRGGTFTITNQGGIGGTHFSPIVNWPEVAILGVSQSYVAPIWDEDLEDFMPRLMLPLSLSYDHRIIDGAEAARFLRWLCQGLESPWKLMMA